MGTLPYNISFASFASIVMNSRYFCFSTLENNRLTFWIPQIPVFLHHQWSGGPMRLCIVGGSFWCDLPVWSREEIVIISFFLSQMIHIMFCWPNQVISKIRKDPVPSELYSPFFLTRPIINTSNNISLNSFHTVFGKDDVDFSNNISPRFSRLGQSLE